MASTRSRHIRKLRQAIKHFETAKIYLAEMGATYEQRTPVVSGACIVAYNTLDELKRHLEFIIRSI